MTSIDLNSDLGENVADRIVSDDASMLDIVTSANVSCGFHAGSPEGIRETLAAQNGNKSRTAEILGIGRKTLYQKIEDYGLEPAGAAAGEAPAGDAGAGDAGARPAG